MRKPRKPNKLRLPPEPVRSTIKTESVQINSGDNLVSYIKEYDFVSIDVDVTLENEYCMCYGACHCEPHAVTRTTLHYGNEIEDPEYKTKYRAWEEYCEQMIEAYGQKYARYESDMKKWRNSVEKTSST